MKQNTCHINLINNLGQLSFFGVALTAETKQHAAIQPYIFHFADTDSYYRKVSEFQ